MHAEDNFVYRLRKAIAQRMYSDLKAPQDGGKFGWEIGSKAFLWILFSEGPFGSNVVIGENDFPELCRYLLDAAERFQVNREQVLIGLYALKKEAQLRGRLSQSTTALWE